MGWLHSSVLTSACGFAVSLLMQHLVTSPWVVTFLIRLSNSFSTPFYSVLFVVLPLYEDCATRTDINEVTEFS